MEQPQEGGSYIRDPKTGKLTLAHRTEGHAVLSEAAAAEEAERAAAADAPAATNSKAEKG